MKKILFAALAVFALVSCAKDVATDVQEYAIDFNPSAKGAVRSTVVDNTNFKSFKVWAYHNETAIMNALEVSRATVADDWTYSPKKYWPAEGTVDFYGLYMEKMDETNDRYQSQYAANATTGLKFNLTMTPATNLDGLDMVLSSDIPDPIYAVALDKSKTSGLVDNKVQMNFRHAMSQVDFLVKNATTAANKITIVVMGVYVDQLYASGDYTLPATSTTTAVGTASNGSWEFKVNDYPVLYWFKGDGIIVSAGSTSGTILSSKGMAFPQQLEDAEFQVDCIIKQDGVTIFDGIKTATVDIDWKEGMKYTYTLLFDDGHIDDLGKTIEFIADVKTIGDTKTTEGSTVRPN